MASHDAGVQVTCPGCAQIVLQKAMIPVLGEGENGIRYLCTDCARAVVVTAGGLGTGSDDPAGSGPGTRSEGPAAAVSGGTSPQATADPDI